RSSPVHLQPDLQGWHVQAAPRREEVVAPHFDFDERPRDSRGLFLRLYEKVRVSLEAAGRRLAGRRGRRRAASFIIPPSTCSRVRAAFSGFISRYRLLAASARWTSAWPTSAC